MKRWNLQIVLKSDLCTATGESDSGMIHTKTALEYGIPYIPAKRIKGCLLEAGKEMADNKVIQREILSRLFGAPGMEKGIGIRISDAHIYSVPQYYFGQEKEGQTVINNYEEFYETVRRTPQITEVLLEEIFTRKRTRTAIEEETGAAQKHSLRTIQTVPSGMIFFSRIEGELNEEDEKALVLCVKGLRHIGIGITRGFGEVCCSLQEAVPENPQENSNYENLFKEKLPEEEMVLPYEIHLDCPVVFSEDSEEPIGQIPGNAVLGALAGMYIQKKKLGSNAHENSDFRRIFLEDGVQFGYGFLKKADKVYLPCPKVIVEPKAEKAVWINKLTEDFQKKNIRAKSINKQVLIQSENIYTAVAEQEIHFHHARPADRGIRHALNDRVKNSDVSMGQFFQYIALSKNQTFAGTWKGQARDIKELLECLEENNYRLMLGRSKTAEYGKCTFRIDKQPIHKRSESSVKGKNWMIWLLTPLVYQNPKNGEYSTERNLFIEQLEDALGCKVEEKKTACGYTILKGYNGRWRLPAVPCPAFSVGSVFHISTEREISAYEIENKCWGIMTGKGCGQVKAELWENVVTGKLIEEAAEDSNFSLKEDKLIKAIQSYKEMRESQTEAVKEAMEQITNAASRLPASSAIAMLLQCLKNQGRKETIYHEIMETVKEIKDQKKRDSIEQFMKCCKEKNYDYIESYLKCAKWELRNREEKDERTGKR